MGTVNPFPNRDDQVPSLDREEELAWVAFYHRVLEDPALATEIMVQLDADPDSRRRRLALYLCCKQSVRAHKARQERDQRIAILMRLAFRELVVRPVLWVADLFAACAPAETNVRRIPTGMSTKPGKAAGSTASTRRLRTAGPEVPQTLRASSASFADPAPGAQPAQAESAPGAALASRSH